MAMHLLERDHDWPPCALLGEIATGQGRIALISGEAGIGKTALVERFLAQARQASVRMLWAACEALFTPRPLGPLYDIARQTASPLRALLDSDAHRATLFAAVLDDLHRRRPSSSSKTSTGPMRRRWISSSTSLAASPIPRPCSS